MAENKNAKKVAEVKEDLVTIKLPREKGSDSVYVCVNDRPPLQIKRGVEVQVPAYVAEVLDTRERQLEAAYDYIESVKSK